MNATLRERLPSAAAAIGLQAGLFALLAVSFNAVRHMGEEKETILVLPPLARPAPAPPLTIDARGRSKTAPTATSGLPGSSSATAITAAPPAVGSSLDGGALPVAPDCIPPGQASSASRTPCPLPPRPAQIDEIPLHPESHVKDEAHWAEQWEREHAEYLPGVTAGERSIHVELFNSNGPSLLGGYRTPVADPTHAHATDAEFQKALAAHQARQLELSGRARPAGVAP